ncbi:MAG: hypothetical protein P8X74_19065 [Reinekea sp.]|jgi:hypothetical protein
MPDKVIAGLPSGLIKIETAIKLIKKGEYLSIAGDAKLLAKLPKGNWIGGSIPYFMGPRGGESSLTEVFVHRLGVPGEVPTIKSYDITNLDHICLDAPDNGYSLIILPGFSEVHAYYARNAPNFDQMFMKPIVGWVSGVHLDHLADEEPIVFDGRSGTESSEAAMVMHIPLPENFHAHVDIINGMQQSHGPSITFPSTGFSVTTAVIEGKEQNFGSYLLQNKVDIQKPLVADYCGAQVNVSIREVDEKSGRVDFYAPVFSDSEYRIGEGKLPVLKGLEGKDATFSCNCVLNYLYENLEGKYTAGYTGPMTFGEIAYLLLNQTLVHLSIVRT